MEKKKISSKEVFYIVLLIGVIAFAGVYLNVYMKYTELTDALISSNYALEKEVQEIKVYYDNMPLYEQQIDEMTAAIQEVADKFPADAKEEDAIMLAVNMEENCNIGFTSISMAKPGEIHKVSADMMRQVGIEGMEQDLVFSEKKASYLNRTDYENLKKCVETVYDAPGFVSVEGLVYLWEEEQECMIGTMDLCFYSLQGNGKEYVAPEMKDYNLGTTNIFMFNKQEEE